VWQLFSKAWHRAGAKELLTTIGLLDIEDELGNKAKFAGVHFRGSRDVKV
jgi:hypothetical protein